MEILEAKELAHSLMKEHGLFDKGWKFEFNNRKKSFGVCSYNLKTIFLSKPITALNDVFEVKDTILHEIAHALVPIGHGHDAVWKAMAKKIGCNAERLGVYETPKGKYIGTCKQCGHTYFMHKKPKRHRSCAKCDTKFNSNYIVEFSLQKDDNQTLVLNK